MKILLRGCAYLMGAIMGAAIGAYAAGWCPWISCGTILLGCSCGLVLALRELNTMRRYERLEAERARRSAYKAALFREIKEIDR